MNEHITRIREVNRKILAFLTTAIQQGALEESVAFAAAIGKMVASGSADPASVVSALKMLEELSADLDAAIGAAQAVEQ